MCVLSLCRLSFDSSRPFFSNPATISLERLPLRRSRRPLQLVLSRHRPPVPSRLSALKPPPVLSRLGAWPKRLTSRWKPTNGTSRLRRPETRASHGVLRARRERGAHSSPSLALLLILSKVRADDIVNGPFKGVDLATVSPKTLSDLKAMDKAIGQTDKDFVRPATPPVQGSVRLLKLGGVLRRSPSSRLR